MKNLFTLLFLLFSVFSFSQEWSQVASLPNNHGTDHGFGFALDGTGYIVGGTTPNGVSKAFYSYDPIADAWTQKQDFPGLARGFAIGEVWNGKAYFGFGANGNSLLKDFWEYDPQTDVWTRLADCGCDGRTHPAMVALNGEIYMGLGGTVNGNDNDWWVYNIENDAWEERTTYPAAPRHHPYQFTDGRYVYVAFGHGNGFISNQVYRYDPTDDSWIEVKTLPSEGRVAGTQMSYDGVGLILSGDGDDHGQMQTGEFWMYEPAIDDWTLLTPHPGLSRWAPTSFILNEEVYLINGERNGSYLMENYKFDISGLTKPNLTLTSDDDVLDFQVNNDNCNASAIKRFGVQTTKPFDEDANVTVVVDPSSTAVEGLDYIFENKKFILEKGQLSFDFEITVFDDAIVKGDKTIILNLDTDVDFSDKNVEFVIEENDQEFGVDGIVLETLIGSGNASFEAPFTGFYEDARTQFLYRKALLENAGLNEGPIRSISFNVETNNAAGYSDFTISIAHTNLSSLFGAPSNTLALVEVFKASFNPEPGINEIVFNTPFDYDGESNLVIQICFDNQAYSTNDMVTATDVGYNSTAGTLSFATGCPISGEESINSSLLPNIIFGKDGFYTPFTQIDVDFQSEILDGETIYFTSGDSIFAEIINVSSVEANCFTSQLTSVTNDVVTSGNFDWVDRVYSFENENNSTSDYLLTLVLPNVPNVDWNSNKLVGLYSDNEPTGETTEWTPIDLTSVKLNEKYVLVSFPYQGNGYYASGGEGISTSTFENELDLVYDNVIIYNVSGIAVASGKSDINIEPKWNGIYFKVYTQKGKIVKSEKIFR